MSDYQARKARAQELQRQKEADLARELQRKSEREKQRSSHEQNLQEQRERSAREARRQELLKANQAMNESRSGASTTGALWDPFAEDTRPPPPSWAGLAEKAPRVSMTSRAGPSKPRPASKKSRTDKSPPPLSRKERAARAFAQQAKKTAGSDSIFSVRALVEKTPLTPRDVKTQGSAKNRLKETLAKEGMRKLCPDRETRDRRTIDEIQNDIKARRKRKRSLSVGSGADAENPASVSAQIQAIFGRPGRRPPQGYDSDGSSDMEADLSDVEAEERQTTKLGRLEDQQAEREEKERKEAKERAKKARGRA